MMQHFPFSKPIREKKCTYFPSCNLYPTTPGKIYKYISKVRENDPILHMAVSQSVTDVSAVVFKRNTSQMGRVRTGSLSSHVTSALSRSWPQTNHRFPSGLQVGVRTPVRYVSLNRAPTKVNTRASPWLKGVNLKSGR